MKSFFDWYQERSFDPSQPWLILGKGPSFSRLEQHDVGAYRLLSLNHVVRERRVDVAHIIDADVVEACGDRLLENAGVVVMPWVPHADNHVGEKTLEDLVSSQPILARLVRENRLLWYNLATARRRVRAGSPVVGVRYFSVEAALNLLATAGARQVRTLGIDGGATYSARFQDLNDTTLLANARSGFDEQFQEIARTIRTTGILCGPLDMEVPARVYVGSTEAQMLAVKVLEFSIRKHASLSVEVFPLHRAPIEVPVPADPAQRPRTPFSFHRFLIPAWAGNSGRALYVDSDMQVFKDLRGLWGLPFEGADLLTVAEPAGTGRRPQFSVMLLDCGALRWDIRAIVADLDAGRLTYETLMYEMRAARNVRASIDPAWNSLERYDEGRTALLHYTDMPTQPWISARNPLGHLWVRDLLDAIDEGAISRAEVQEEAGKGHIRPSLLYQIDRRHLDATTLPARVRQEDEHYVAPYQQMGGRREARRPAPTGIWDRVRHGVGRIFR